MSRIGKLPIIIPKGVNVNYSEEEIIVEGKFGRLDHYIPQVIYLTRNNNILKVNIKEKSKTKDSEAVHGLYRTMINNMIIGVSEQFEKTLILKGVGYRAIIEGNLMTLNLGYSHPVKIDIPEDISAEIIQNTTINFRSCNKNSLGLFVSGIRIWRPPEPYKGKGILYKNEKIIRKDGKSAK
uniref:Ribosomal protein L6 n=1 Tax=Climaconeis sp. TaxID=2846830 RepID=A0A8F8SPC9_9STRA|nr:ribosomal protein L6 [Climaconeis sp.]